MNDYPLTLEHVRQFLATKEDDDRLGECGNAKYCLLSEVLNWLYPEPAPWRVDLSTYDRIGAGRLNQFFRLDDQVNALRRAFDHIHDYSYPREHVVTKHQLRAYLKHLASEDGNIEQEWHFGVVSFAVTDLFPTREEESEVP